MLNIRVSDYGFEMQGHCGYAPRGEDIVCAAISALYITYAINTGAVERVQGDTRRIEAGAEHKALHDALYKAMVAIAEKYPKNIALTTLPR